MIAPLILQWWFAGAWHEIGWRATTPRSRADLTEHGRLLAAAGDRYRLVTPTLTPGVDEVVHVYPQAVFA